MAWFISQSAVMIVLAFLLGLLVGWLIWGRRVRALNREVVVLREAAAACKANHGDARPAEAKGAKSTDAPAKPTAAASVPVSDVVSGDHPEVGLAGGTSRGKRSAKNGNTRNGASKKGNGAAAKDASAAGTTSSASAGSEAPSPVRGSAAKPVSGSAAANAPTADGAASTEDADVVMAAGSIGTDSIADSHADAASADDANVDGAINDTNADDSTTDNLNTDGSSTDTDGTDVDGTVVDGIAANDAAVDGIVANDAAVDGIVANDAAVDGIVANDTNTNEASSKGTEDVVLVAGSVALDDEIGNASTVRIPSPRAELGTPDGSASADGEAEAVVGVAGAIGIDDVADTRLDDLGRIEGIGPKIAAALVAAGIRTFAQLADADEATLTAAIRAAGITFAPSLGTWAQQARLLADGDEEGFMELTERLIAGRVVTDIAPETTDDLARIEGIGPKIAAALVEAGIRTYARLADASVDTLNEAIRAGGIRFAPSLVTWSQQARLLADGDEERFAQLTAELIAGRRVVEDDLERIEGIGPKIAAALQSAGIRTFRHLADSSDIRLRNAISGSGLSFAPSIVTWARQARLLADGDEDGFAELTRRLVAGRDEGRA